MAQAATKQAEHAGDDLADQIDSLLSDLDPSAATDGGDATAKASESELESDTGPGDELTEAEVESLAAQIDDLVGEVDRAAGGDREAEQAEPAKQSDVATPEAVALVERSSDERADAGETDASVETGGPAGGPTAEQASPDLAGLDEQLAASAVVGEGEADDLIASAAILAPDPSAGRATGFESVEEIGDEPEAAPSIAAPASPVARASTKIRFGQMVGLGFRGAKAGAVAGLAWSSKAYSRAPAVVQDTIGWIGLVTVFFAGCLWVSVLFFRGTPTPEVYGAPSAVLEPGDPTPHGRPRPTAGQEADGGTGGESGGGGG